MGQGEAETARRVYGALNRRDIDGALRHLDPEVEWHMSGSFARTARVFRGHDGIREVVALFDEALEQFRVEPTSLHVVDDAVVAVVAASGLVRGTGDRSGYELVNVWRFRDGRASVVEAYSTLEEAWAAVGKAAPAASSASISAPGTGRENR